MRIIGYGVCGPHEQYLEDTLKEFKRLCDEVVIVGNNLDEASARLIDSYGFHLVIDDREWGKHQHQIKEDLLAKEVSQLKPDWCIALDMDETFDPKMSRADFEKITAYGNALYFYIINLWNEGWKRQWSFWNVRAFKWNGVTKFINRPLHCGLAPEWAYHYGSYAPYLLFHKGLKEKEARLRKVKRYETYDPKAKYRDRSYYEGLKEETCEPLNLEQIYQLLNKELDYKSQKPKEMKIMTSKYFYVRTPHGETVDIPERDLAETLARPGFTLIDEVGTVYDSSPIKFPQVAESYFCPLCGEDCGDEKALKKHKTTHAKAKKK
jgi:hypothetical protein